MKWLAILSSCWAFAYLYGAFTAASFDISTWDPCGRGMLGAAATLAACVIWVNRDWWGERMPRDPILWPRDDHV